VEERRVVVEEVAVGEKAGGPAPGDVEVLRLVGVEAVAEEGDGAEDGARGDEEPEEDMARPEGFEPPTGGSEVRCSVQLS
jgi:hypothetical protein